MVFDFKLADLFFERYLASEKVLRDEGLMPITFPCSAVAIKILLFVMQTTRFADEYPSFSFLVLNPIQSCVFYFAAMTNFGFHNLFFIIL
jgi:hypothetical protein